MYELDLPKDVRFWSHFVLLSKRIAVDKYYYEDEFIKYFSSQGTQDPLLSLTSYVRVVGIRTIIETFLSEFTGDKVQFVNLGSSLDTVSLYLLSKYPNLVCFDLDLEKEIKTKIDIITHTKELLSLFPNYKVEKLDFYSNRYHVLECDLRDVRNLDKLKSHGFSYELPTVFLSEFVLTYLENHLSNQVIKHFCDNCRSFRLFVDLEYGKLTPMHSLSDYFTKELQIQRYKELGWDGIFSCDYNFIYNNFINKHERKRLRSIENFNEMDSLGLYCSQPLIIVAHNNFNHYLINKFNNLFKEKETNTNNTRTNNTEGDNTEGGNDDDELLPYLSDEYLEKDRSLDPIHQMFYFFFRDNQPYFNPS
ncbi:Leucine carboxyl methyltransferase family protein [Theileria parva strain Muguga]|uniref:Leucine carboxyl methyltransferase family protein n=1 Tax=Theileria parva strain Muguga TaxID=333668 RepID=UPI001C61DF75|nr:Leucine carboxyl methyltransferase family protein [Theileria parva strain Muguga]EAN31487.2 Leucine carboxyl methyltransferase family protein [Theileria parva strain Muguga]